MLFLQFISKNTDILEQLPDILAQHTWLLTFFLYSLATRRVFLLEKSHENNWILDAGTEYSVDELGRVSRWKPRVDGRMQP